MTAEQIFGTELDLDRYQLSPAEAEELRRLEEEIVAAPAIELPAGVSSLEALPGPAQEAIARLDRIFWERLPQMEIGVIFREVKPVGGAAKAKAVADSLAQTGLKLADTIYVGDGLTDVQAFEAVRAGGGLAISFNGNRYAVKAAEVVVVSDCAWSIGMLAAIFRLWGKEGVLEVAAPETAGQIPGPGAAGGDDRAHRHGPSGPPIQYLSVHQPQPGEDDPGERGHAGPAPGRGHRRAGVRQRAVIPSCVQIGVIYG